MELDDITKKNKLIGRVGVLISLVFLFLIVDNFVSSHREPSNAFRALPGTEQAVSGKVGRRLTSKDDVALFTDSNRIKIEFQEPEGGLWRGILKIGSFVEPGVYSFMVVPRGESPTEESPRYKVRVFPDKNSYQHSFKSVIYRYTGVSPLWIAISLVPLIALTFGLSYYLSGKKEDLLAREGKAEIFKVIKKSKNWEITFGLGQKHGLNQGDPVLVYDREGTMLGKAEVTKVYDKYASADLSDLPELKPHYVVRSS